jgi:hypothetical protein
MEIRGGGKGKEDARVNNIEINCICAVHNVTICTESCGIKKE